MADKRGVVDITDDDDRSKRRRASKWQADEEEEAAESRKASDMRAKSVAELPQQPVGEMQYAAVDNFRAATARYMDVARQLRARVYVGNLEPSTGEQEIMHIFSAFGQVHNVHMPREAERSKGYCFVEYLDQHAANLAIASMKGFMLGGRHIRVSKPTEQRCPQVAPHGLSGVVATPMGLPATPVTRSASAELRLVTISGLASDYELKDVRSLSLPYGNVLKCEMLPPASEKAAFRLGFAGRAAVEYDTELSAFSALRALQGHTLKGGTCQLHVGLPGSTAPIASTAGGAARPAPVPIPVPVPMPMPVPVPMPVPALQNAPVEPITSKILKIENMVPPGEADEDLADEVKEECEAFGKIKDVKVEEIGAKKAVRVLVTFTAPGEVEKAIKALNGRWFGGRQIKAAQFFKEKTNDRYV